MNDWFHRLWSALTWRVWDHMPPTIGWRMDLIVGIWGDPERMIQVEKGSDADRSRFHWFEDTATIGKVQ